jgi:hypothetical protein
MPRFYFHLYNDETVLDAEGTELPNVAAALQSAASMARQMAAQSVRDGHLVLHHRIEIAGQSGEIVGSVRFGDVVRVQD